MRAWLSSFVPAGLALAALCQPPAVYAAMVVNGKSQSDVAGLAQSLERLCNSGCAPAGGDKVVVSVRFSVDSEGRAFAVVATSEAASPIATAAKARAVDAVHQAEPYGAVYRDKTFTVNFDAKTACANR